MEILNKTEIMDVPEIYLIFAVITVLSFIGIMIMCACNLQEIALVMACICLVGLFGSLLTTLFCEGIPTGRYKYEVILDKSYSATELYENYDVIEQRGRIWIIEDKEND